MCIMQQQIITVHWSKT